MLITKNVYVKMSYFNIDHYIKLGHKVKKKDIIKIDVKDLAHNDSVIIEAKCEKCNTIVERRYKDYLINMNNHYFSCSYNCSKDKVKLTNLERYGFESPMKSKEIQEKIKLNNLEKYGVESPQSLDSVKEKIKKINLEKYGSICYSKTNNWKKSVKDKWKIKSKEDIKEIMDNKAITNLEKYGVKHVLQSEDIKNKSKETCMEKYGVEYISQSKEFRENIKKICLEKYGVDHYWKSKKFNFRKSMLDKHGVENPMFLEKFKNKSKETCMEKYGVENVMQDHKIFDKSLKNSYKTYKYKDTYLHYQGSYELDFLNSYYNKYIIENGPSIKYKFEGKNKVYHSDFYLPKYNLIIEIKSDYTYNVALEKNLEKEKACLEQGFNFIFIINKDYNKMKDYNLL